MFFKHFPYVILGMGSGLMDIFGILFTLLKKFENLYLHVNLFGVAFSFQRCSLSHLWFKYNNAMKYLDCMFAALYEILILENIRDINISTMLLHSILN